MSCGKIMAEQRGSLSTAWKITWSFMGRLALLMIVIDVLFVTVCGCAFFYTQEKTVMGEAWRWDMERMFENGFYVFDGTHRLDLVPYKTPLIVVGGTIAGIELLIWLIEIPHSVNRARRYLRPLDEIAQATRKLAELEEEQRLYGNKIREAEEAISHFAPGQPDAKLYTGDRDLAGIENAVNTLLARIHQSYRQQIRFVSDASHELRTPISVIQGYADMLDRWGKEDEAILAESIHAIQSESENMKKLVEQLLFLARGDSGRNPLTMEELRLDQVVQEVYEEYMMIDEHHQWQLEAPMSVQARGDGAMLKQAFRILADNASKYTPQGEKICLRAYYNEQGCPCMEVQDQGIGMSAEEASHIFERFYRADEARSHSGSGLGLAIAKWIVDRHGGHFEVLSREELGTRMTLVLEEEKGAVALN